MCKFVGISHRWSLSPSWAFFLVILEQLLRSIFILRSSEDWSIRNKDTFVMREPNWTSTERALNGTFVRKVASVILNPIDNETPCAPINIKQERLWTFFSVVFRLPKLLQGKSLTTITHNWPRALRYVYEEMRGSCTKWQRFNPEFKGGRLEQ